MSEQNKVVIGMISYNDKHYLEKALPKLIDLPEARIVILDNAQNDDIKKYLKKNYPQITYLRHPKGNIGFSRGHNYIIKESSKSKYYFCLNTDILIEKNGYTNCIKVLDENETLTMISGKLYHWDFKNSKKTNVIDTLGIIGSRGHHFWDRGQGKIDKGQYDDTINNVFGVSGAAFFVRRLDIKKLYGVDSELFDETIFMYKDDVDLAYRMRWLGLKIKFLPDVLGYHARTLGKGKKKSLFEAKNSYKNHLIMLRSNVDKKYKLQTKLSILMYEIIKFLYYLIIKPKVLTVIPQAFKMKIRKSKRTISSKKMEKYFLK